MKQTGNLLIIGDSYSTFEGYIPEGFSIYYKNPPCPYTDLTKVEETWWHQFVKKTNGNLVLNSSFSGSTVCNTGYDGKIVKQTSFLGRLKTLIDEHFFEENKIDTVIVFGGTNDSWANSPIGSIKYSDWTEEDELAFLPAFGELLALVKEKAPDASLITVINTELKDEIVSGIKEISLHYGADNVVLSDIDKLEGHPTVKGMEQMYVQICEALGF